MYITSMNFVVIVHDQYSPPRTAPYPPRSPLSFLHGPGQQVQYAPMSGPGSTSHSGLIDPCNLFIKVRANHYFFTKY